MSNNSNASGCNVLVHSCTLQDLFNCKDTPLQLADGSNIEGEIVIPEYQRPYQWDEKNIDKLLHDVKEYHYLDVHKDGRALCHLPEHHHPHSP